MKPITILSCVDGGTLERLARGFIMIGRPAAVVASIDADDWRAGMKAGAAQRLKTRLTAMVRFPLHAIVHALRRRPHVLIATTNPFFLPGLMVALRPLHRSPVIALVYDLWPDAAIADEKLSADGLAARIAQWFNGWSLRNADAVVFLGDAMQATLIQRYGAPRAYATIPTGADPAELGSSRPTSGHAQNCSWFGSGLAVSYVGNMGAMHDQATLAAAAPALAEANVSVVVAGWGVGLDRLQESLPTRSAIAIRGPLDDTEWVQVLSETQVALITLNPAAVESSLPSKVFSALAAGCAIVAVAPAGSDLANVVASTAAGVVVEPGDAAGLVDALVRYDRDSTYLTEHQLAARVAADTRYDLVSLARRWDALLRPIDAKVER